MRQDNDWVIDTLTRIFTPRTPEKIAADDLRYRQMIYRLYNALLLGTLGERWNMDLPAGFPWDEFTKLNPTARDIAHRLQEDQRYELSERQCSNAVMALRAYPHGPRIEVGP